MAKTIAEGRKRRSDYQGGTSARFMIRLPESLRREWQREANQAAGRGRGAPLGPWVRAMVQQARGAQR